MNSSYRADIDGLRAIAILAVLGFHAAPRFMPGGFTGVDIFFVISGYLISGLIFAGLEAGTFSFGSFYARRIRRIFPALIVILVAVWIAGWFILLPGDLASVGRHLLAGAGFGSNLLVSSEVGYFDAPAATKPLLHLWSLGVEEQFYLIFPAIFALVSTRRRTPLRIVIACVAIASFALNVLLVRSNPSLAFYLPFTRLWQFLVGSALALTVVDGSRVPAPRWLRESLSTVGFALLIASVAFVRETDFPGAWALLPTCGALLVMAAGPAAWVNRYVLAVKPLVFIGLISYPLYLWHWPLLVMARSVGRTDGTATAAVIAVSLVLSWLTYQFVERRVRAPMPARRARRVTSGLVAGVVACGIVGLVTIKGEGFPARYPEPVRQLLTLTYHPTELLALYDCLRGALDRSIGPCASLQNASTGPLLVMVGDSHSDHLFLGLRRLQQQRPFRIWPFSWDTCPPVREFSGKDAERCRLANAALLDRIIELKPEVVVVSGFWLQYHRIDSITETLTALKKAGIPNVILVGPSPHWPEPVPKLLYDAFTNDVLHRVPERLSNFDKAGPVIDARLQAIAIRHGVTYFSPFGALCNPRGCLVRVGDRAADLIQVDLDHYSAVGSWFVVSRMAIDIFR